MYSIGIFANISELTTFSFANIKSFAEKNFLQKDNFTFTLYTKEQKEIFLANVQTNAFDGIVFATNTANDLEIKEYFETNKSIFSHFLSMGGGVLVLLQYHLAINNNAFDILSCSDFSGLGKTPIITRANNTDNGPVQFDSKKIKCQKDDFIFNYPRAVLTEGPDSFWAAMQSNKWQSSATPLFATIKAYPKNDFRSIIDYIPIPNENSSNMIEHESFCIISRNATKRVVYTTLALDLENNLFLENLISYIAKGVPCIYFHSCGKCNNDNNTCDYIDLLNNTKIHFSDSEFAKNYVKYEIYHCEHKDNQIEANCGIDSNIIPMKQLLPINNSGRISQTVNVSAVQYMCKLGAHYLKTQLKNGKYGSLIGTLATLRLFEILGYELGESDKNEILEYLKNHNADKKTFDSIMSSTIIAHQILVKINYCESAICFNIDSSPEHDQDDEVQLEALSNRQISEIAKILSKDNTPLKTILGGNNIHQNKEFLLKLFSQIISLRDVGKISWEKDCFMTSTMLISLYKIEEFLQEYDRRFNTNCVSKINIIATYFESSSENSLYSTLVSSADSERENAYRFSVQLNDEKKKNTELSEEIEKLRNEKRDFDMLNTKIRIHQAVNIGLIFLIVAMGVFGVLLFLNAKNSNSVYDLIISLSPIEIILSIASLILVPFTIGSFYYHREKTTTRSKSFWNRMKSFYNRRKKGE